MHRNDRAAEGTGAAQTASVPSGNQRRVSPRRDWGRFYVVGGFSLSALVHLSTLLLLVAVAVRHHERGAGEGVSLRAAYSQSEGDGLDLDSVEFGMELPESAREESLTPLLAENDPAQEPTEAVENAEDEVDALTASVNAPIVGPDTISASTLVMTTSMLESQPLTATVPLPPSEAISMEMNASHVPPSGRAPTGQDLARAKATFFGSTAQGLRFVFVVDCSGSMASNDRLKRAREELLRCLGEMRPPQSYTVIFYDSNAIPQSPCELTAATAENYETTSRWVMQREPGSGTNPLGALRTAYALRPDAVFLMTDGEFENVNAVEKLVKDKVGSKIPVNTISFSGQAGKAVMERIATASGGRYSHVE